MTVTVITLLFPCDRLMPEIDQLLVPLAVPLPPLLLTQLTEDTPMLSEAVPGEGNGGLRGGISGVSGGGAGDGYRRCGIDNEGCTGYPAVVVPAQECARLHRPTAVDRKEAAVYRRGGGRITAVKGVINTGTRCIRAQRHAD